MYEKSLLCFDQKHRLKKGCASALIPPGKIFRLGQESGMKKQTKISLTNGNKKRGDGKKIMESSHHFSLIKNMD